MCLKRLIVHSIKIFSFLFPTEDVPAVGDELSPDCAGDLVVGLASVNSWGQAPVNSDPSLPEKILVHNQFRLKLLSSYLDNE